MSRTALYLTCIGMLLLLAPGCSEKQVETTDVLRPVRYQPVYATGGTRTRTFSGVARAGMESNLSFRVSGTVEKLPVSVGDSVRADQLIASLDPNNYDLQVQEAQASLERAQAEARNAAANYERVRSLYESRNASRTDLDAARAADESASAAVRSAEKRLELARLQLSYCRLTAPVTGAIASVAVDVNENVRAGQTIALLTSGSRTEVEVAVPEILIAQVREGDRVTVEFDALPDKQFDARVTEVGIASTGVVTTFPVRVTLDRTGDVRPGMAAEVAFTFDAGDDRARFIVPPVAVGEDRSGRFVFVVEPVEEGIGEVHRRPVSVGDLTSDGMEVIDGLVDGDLLVTAGISKIREGLRVRIGNMESVAP